MATRKKCKLIHTDTLNSPSAVTREPIDWSLCALCQESSDKPLSCPAKSKRTDIGAGYQSLGDNLNSFLKLGKQPLPIDISRLDEGDGIVSTLTRNNAQWHPSCRLKCCGSRLARAELSSVSTTCSDAAEGLPYMLRQAEIRAPLGEMKCFFCDEVGTDAIPLHEAMTPRITNRVKHCAFKLQDQKLIAKLSQCDLVAQEAKYHANCLVKLYNASSRKTEEGETQNSDRVSHGLALVELLGYIEDVKLNSKDIAPIFKLTDLVQLYTNRLVELGVKITGRIHSTDLKNRILANMPGLQAYKQGRDVLLSFNDDVGFALRDACLDDGDDEAICLAKAARIIRRDMLEKSNVQFDGTFPQGCQEDAVPKSLVALVSMSLDGPNIKRRDDDEARQATLSIAQVLQYNSSVRRRDGSTGTHHNKSRETPLAIYLGMMIHGHTRKRELVDTLFHLGLSISYDRVLDISMNTAISAAQQYESEGVVCPLILRKNLFTTAAIDNLDHNPSSTTSQGAFHGTGISIFQNRAAESDGIIRHKSEMQTELHGKQIPPLPESYTMLTPVTVKKDPIIPPTEGALTCDGALVGAAMEEEQKWQSNTRRLISETVQTVQDPISWAAYHSIAQEPHKFEVTIGSLLPLFPDDSKSAAMIRHSMDIVQQAVHLLNPGQVPVLTLDQPLFTIAKHIQWSWPDEYGEKKFVILLGGLHIEMASLATLGDLLDGSGWTHALAQADIATPGTAESFLKASHVTRTRHAHQVTASALSILLHKAYDAYSCEDSDPIAFEEWCEKRIEVSPQFQYWVMIMKLELLVLVYVRSLREAKFSLYVAVLAELAPWFFALDHTHYARWLPIHIRDMMTLPEQHPDVARHFAEGGFVVHKTKRPLSAIAIDHAHEQHNKIVKGDGGAVGLLQNPRALLRWMVAGPELARAIEEFEVNCLERGTGRSEETNLKHHEHTVSTQVKFATQCGDLVRVIEDMGNPFMEENEDLLVLDSRDIADPAIVQTVREIEKTGQDQYNKYMTERVVERTIPVSDPINRNKMPLFSKPPLRAPSKSKQIVTSLKNDCALFSRLYIACQTREGNLDNFFKHENHAYPPALSQLGKLRFGTKSDLTECLEKFCTSSGDAPLADVIILDGAAIINMLKPIGIKTFQEYATQVFLPYVKAQLRNVTRVDIIWDVYLEESLKSTARENRGRGVRRRVAPSNTIPGNWQEFLRLADNKTELFDFLAHQVLSFE